MPASAGMTVIQSILNEWRRSKNFPQGQVMRAKIILVLSEGMTPTGAAVAQGTSAKERPHTAGTIASKLKS
jgi:hypothetical protein